LTTTDNDLGAAARRQSSAERVPQQLPAAVAHFAGRVGELAMLTGRRWTSFGGGCARPG